MWAEIKSKGASSLNPFESLPPEPSSCLNIADLFHMPDGIRNQFGNRLLNKYNLHNWNLNGCLSLDTAKFTSDLNDSMNVGQVTELLTQCMKPSEAGNESFIYSLTETLLRGQQKPDGSDHRWENKDGGEFFHYTKFPTVLRWTRDKVSGAAAVGYYAFYSSFQPVGGKQSHAILTHEPIWRKVNLTSDPGTNNSPYVNLDVALVGDSNCLASIIASLQNSFPVSGSYVYFMPDVSMDVMYNNPIFANAQNHRITGASLGMAVFAVVSGWPSLYYTGYIKYITPNHLLSSEAMTRQYQNIVNSGESLLENRINNIRSYNVLSGLVPVLKQLNFVEMVQDIPLKIAFCTSMGAALLFPAASEIGDNVISALNKRETSETFMQLIRALPSIYTMSMAQDGQPALMNGRMETNYMGSTVTEFSQLSLIALYYLVRDARGIPFQDQAGLPQMYTQLQQYATKRFDTNQTNKTNKAAFLAPAKATRKEDPARWEKAKYDYSVTRKADAERKKKAKKDKSAMSSAALKRIKKEYTDNLQSAVDNWKASKRAYYSQKHSAAQKKKWLSDHPDPTKAFKSFKRMKMNTLFSSDPDGFNVYIPRNTDPKKLLAGRVKAMYENQRDKGGLHPDEARRLTHAFFSHKSSLTPEEIDAAIDGRPLSSEQPNNQQQQQQYRPNQNDDDQQNQNNNVFNLPDVQKAANLEPRPEHSKAAVASGMETRAENVKKAVLSKYHDIKRDTEQGAVAKKKKSGYFGTMFESKKKQSGASASGLFGTIGDVVDDIL